MKRQIIYGTMLSAVLAIGAAAQEPPAQGQPGSRSPGAQPGDPAKTVTMSGCLQAASSTAAGSTGGATAAPGTASAGRGGFILTNASMGSMASAKPSAEPGAPAGSPAGATAGTTGTGAAGSTYRLMGGEDQNLQQYVGQRVEVTGTLNGRGMGSGGAASAGAPAGPGATGSAPGSAGAAPGAAAGTTSPGQGAGPALRIASVRPTGERCSQ